MRFGTSVRVPLVRTHFFFSDAHDPNVRMYSLTVYIPRPSWDFTLGVKNKMGGKGRKYTEMIFSFI